LEFAFGPSSICSSIGLGFSSNLNSLAREALLCVWYIYTDVLIFSNDLVSSSNA